MIKMSLNEDFWTLKRLYDENKFEEILQHDHGIYFLKLRSISRAAILRELGSEVLNIDCSGINAQGNKLFEFIFSQNITNELLNNFIEKKYWEDRNTRIENEDYLYSQLYKLHSFSWGGFHQNSVEKNLVDNYIKKIQDYAELCLSIENDINPRIREYILASWYNNWSSILIEDMFKDHPDILPAVGLIKKIDFFWRDFPFDLKVTYFPDGFIQEKRSKMGLRKEVIELKKFARKNKIYFDNQARESEIFNELLAKISEDPSNEAKEFMDEFYNVRKEIISETIQNPEILIKWLYENQGVRRFDAANRFFIILIDVNNMEESWKLKRNKNLLESNINSYLNDNKTIDFEDLKISFNWEDQEYTTYATTLFVLKN